MLTQFEHNYRTLVKDILSKGDKRTTRNADTLALFGTIINFDLSKSEFPIIQGRKYFYKGVLGEFAAFMRQPKNIKDFEKFDCNYWKKWAKPDGSLKVDYGNAWFDFNGVNQIAEVRKALTSNPTDRRMIVSGWRPNRIPELSLPCCHLLYQWFVREDKYLDMIWYQRSVDTMIGLPADAILAALWNTILAQECGYVPGKVIMMLGDTHIYEPHITAAHKYLSESSKVSNLPENTPIYTIKSDVTLETFVPSDLELRNYDPKPIIKFELLA